MVQSRFLQVAAIALSLFGADACSRVETSPAPASSSSANATLPPTHSAVQSIAFVDQEEACECTRKRINDTWAALQAAMKQTREVPVQRIHRDTQPGDVAPLQARRAFVAVPAIYLLDAAGEVIDVLQGEVTDKELAAALR